MSTEKEKQLRDFEARIEIALLAAAILDDDIKEMHDQLEKLNAAIMKDLDEKEPNPDP